MAADSRQSASRPFRHHGWRRSSAAVALLGLMVGPTAFAQNRSWNTGVGNWATAANWWPASVPGPANEARIGDIFGIHNSTVNLNQHATVAELELSDGMRLLLNGNRMTVNGRAQVVGRNVVSNGPGLPDTVYTSWIRVDAAAGTAFRADQLELNGGGAFSLYDDALVDIDDSLSLAAVGHPSAIAGRGTIRLNGAGATLINNGGLIHGGADGGLILQQTNGGAFDLDGFTGDGAIEVNGSDGARLRLVGTQLADAFSGDITLMRGSSLEMELSDGWTADANSGFLVLGVYPAQPPAQLSGGEFTFAGVMQITGEDARLEVSADAIITPEARILVATDDRLIFGVGGATTTVDGGDIEIGPGGMMRILGPTVLEGGVFANTSPGDLALDLDLAGPTTWRGAVTIDGYARQEGDATVTAATTIHGDYLDLDGSTANTHWTISAPCAINVDQIDAPGFGNNFDGTLTIGGGLVGGLFVNLNDPAMSWTMGGAAQLSGNATLYPTRISGSPLIVTGTLAATSGKSAITAPTTIADAATVNLPTANDHLRFGGRVRIEGGAAFTGVGLLVNGAAGAMRLDDGVATDQVGLQNRGVLSIADTGAGVVTVDRFEQVPGASARVSVGGAVAGGEHDLLIVAGPATLAGTLEVELFHIGNGQFDPQIGDEFTVITAAGGVSGMFESDPVSCAGDEQFHWTVIYDPNEVTLRLDAITAGVPGDMNCDCAVTVSDIAGFVLALTNPAGYSAAFPDCSFENADVNDSGTVTVSDIANFVALLTQ